MSHCVSTLRYPKLIRGSALATLFVCAMGVLGWILDVPFLRTPLEGFAPIRPITAIAFVAISAAILLRSFAPESMIAGRTLSVVGLMVAALGAYVLAAYVFGFTTFLDNFLVPNGYVIADVAGNRMPPQTAANFFFVGIALFLLEKRGLLGQLGGLATLAALALTYAVILGVLYHASEFSGISNRNTMAITAALSFVLTGSALLAMNAECRVFRLFTNGDLGGHAARRLLPVIIAVPTLVGWLRVLGQDSGLYDTAFGTAMSMFILVLLMFVMVIFYSLQVSKSDQKRLIVEDELAKRETRYRDLFDYNQGMICIHDVDGAMREVNPAVVASTGYTSDDIIGRNIRDFLPPEEQPLISGFFRQIKHEGISNGLLPIVAKDGRQLTWRYQSILVNDEENGPYVIGHAIDVTELVEAQQELRNLSLTDELTGLLNRRGFLTLAEQQLRLERHAGTARGLTLMFADMDGLKKINDTLGHEAGSEGITTLATIVKSVVRSGDLVARWGGDEFVILSVGAGDENIRLMSDRIEASLAEYNASSGKPYDVACSIGVAPVRVDGGHSFEEVIAEADEAMYEEKKRRKAMRQDVETATQQASPELVEDSYAWY